MDEVEATVSVPVVPCSLSGDKTSSKKTSALLSNVSELGECAVMAELFCLALSARRLRAGLF